VNSEDEVEAGSQTVRFKIKDYGAVFKAMNIWSVLSDFERQIGTI
jgi:hypothetical protein